MGALVVPGVGGELSRTSMGGLRADMRACFCRANVALGHVDRRVPSLGLLLVTRWGRSEGVDRLRGPPEIDLVAELTDSRWMSGGVKWGSAFDWLQIRGRGERAVGDPVVPRGSSRDVDTTVAASLGMAEARVRHRQVQVGRHDVELIVERFDHRVVVTEVKLSALVEARDVRHLLLLREQLGDDLPDAVIVTTG